MYNDSFGNSVKRGYLGLPVAIRAIITINVAVFLIQSVLSIISPAYSNALIQAFAFFPIGKRPCFNPGELSPTCSCMEVHFT